MNTSKKLTNTIDGYIKSFPANIQTILEKVRTTMKAEIPEGEEKISYGIPTFQLKGRSLIFFAGYKKHISIYPTNETLEQAIPEVVNYKTSTGTLQFKLDKPIPFDLIRKVTQFKLKERLDENK